VHVTGATKPFWLVLGQSYNEGWHATIGGRDLGTPRLADGFANAWYIRPHGRAAFTVDLAWAPQRAVNLSLWISLAGGLVCLGIVVVGLRRRRGGAADRIEGPVERTEVPGRAVRTRTRVLLTIGTVVVAAITIHPVVGVVAGLLAWAAAGGGVMRRAVRFAPPVLLIATAIGIPIQQRIERYPAFFDWAGHFEWARWCVWFAVIALALDVIVGLLRDEEPRPVPLDTP